MQSTDVFGAPQASFRPPTIRRRVVMALAGALLLGGLAALVPLIRGPQFRSEALLVVVAPQSESTTNGISIASVWAQAAGTETLLGQVATGLDVPYTELASATTVTASPTAPLVSVVVTTADGDRSASWANAVADGLLKQASTSQLSGFTLRSLTKAVPAVAPAPSLSLPLTAGGAMLGALAGVALGQLLSRPRTR